MAKFRDLVSMMDTIDVGSRRQLFIDDRFIAEGSNVAWTLEKPDVQDESLLAPLKSWEQGRAGAWASILRHDGRIHFWYDAYQWDAESGHVARDTHAYCYAVSDDGVHFDKPDLGLIDIDGSTRNNACMRSVEGGPVFIDPTASRGERFRFIGRWAPVRGCAWKPIAGIDEHHTWMFTSPDGVHWNRGREPLLTRWLGGTQSAVWDEDLGRWALFLRAHLPGAHAVTRRAVARMEVAAGALDRPLHLPASADSGKPRPSHLSDELPFVLDVDEDDAPGAQVYVGNVTKYERAQNVYLAFIPVWFDRRVAPDASDKVEVQLAFSRDGIHWQRPWREPLISPGVLGPASAGQIFPVQNPIVVSDEIWLYFNAMAEDHLSETQVKGNSLMARAIWRLDRFVSVGSEARGSGEIVTPPLRCGGGRLLVNANAGAEGHLRVAIEYPDGIELPGHALGECLPFRGDSTSAIVRWRGADGDVPAPVDHPVRLRFELNDCRLYAFEFQP